jgi:hypothetical protein
MLPALGSLATQQANLTQNTKKIVHQLLDYAATHPDAIITYRGSNMVLAGHSDASYLSETNARSRAGGHFFMSNDEAILSNNGAILMISQIITAIMSSAAEAEIGALYINCKEAIPARHTLEYLGHKQPPTPMQTDNTTALGVVNNNIMKKIKVDGHEIPLAPMQNKPTLILPLLGCRQIKQWQLRHQTSHAHPSPSNTINFPHSTKHTSKTTRQSPKSIPRNKGVLDTQYPAIINRW